MSRSATASPPLRPVYFNPSFTPRQLIALGDLKAGGESELAVPGVGADGKVKTELRGATRGILVANLWFGNIEPTELVMLPDINANGSVELALLGITQSEEIRVIIKDALTKELLRRIRF